MNNDKKLFVDTITELDYDSVAGMSGCEKYGTTWGCDPDCPVLNDGKCEYWKSVEEFIEDRCK